MKRLENFFDSKIKGNAEAFGVPVFYTEDLNNLQKKIDLNIANHEPNLEKIAAIVDEDTHRVLTSLAVNARNIQTQADTVFDNFVRFVDLEPIKFNDLPVTRAPFDIDRIKAMYGDIRVNYANRIFELHKEAMKFNKCDVDFREAENLLDLQTKLANSDSLFKKGIDPTTVVPLKNLVVKMKNQIKTIEHTSELLINELKKINEPSRLAGNNLKNKKDPLYFKVIVVYLNYIYEVFALEENAREVHAAIVIMNKEPGLKTVNIEKRFQKDITATNKKLRNIFKKINSLAMQDDRGLENYDGSLKTKFRKVQPLNRSLRAELNKVL